MVKVGDIVVIKNNPDQKFKVTDYKWGVYTINSVIDNTEICAYESAIEVIEPIER